MVAAFISGLAASCGSQDLAAHFLQALAWALEGARKSGDRCGGRDGAMQGEGRVEVGP